MDITGLYYSEDIQFKETSEFDHTYFNSGTIFYEVLRIIDGTALFLEDHLKRLQGSVKLAGYDYQVSVPLILYLLRNLILRNNTANGNIKIVIKFSESRSPIVYTFFIPHFYPGAELYEQGVEAALYYAERNDPNIKKIHHEIIGGIQDFISQQGIYDALLVDNKGRITEGSKTNVFFLQNDLLLTAPPEMVLIGITRTKVFQLCNTLNIKVKETPISTFDLNKYDSAFFTGTSPKILPVRRIDDLNFDVQNDILRLLMKEYDKIIWDYLNTN